VVGEAKTGDEVRRLAAAAAWRVRLTEAEAESSEAFEAWLAADAANEVAWAKVQAIWSRFSEQAGAPEMLAARGDALVRAGAQRLSGVFNASDVATFVDTVTWRVHANPNGEVSG
jgi:ferric-dicitrate binding protein FerR (iron transport regulator)